jgi:hypothetical protein
VEDGDDFVIRLGRPSDSRLIARNLENALVDIYASRTYLKKFGAPRTIEELQTSRFTLLLFLQPITGKLLLWIFLHKAKKRRSTQETPFIYRTDRLVASFLLVMASGWFKHLVG